MQTVKVKLMITETLKYDREVIVEVPAHMTERDIEEALNKAERNYGFDGVDGIVHALKRQGITCPDGFDQDLSSPNSVEAECYDYEVYDEI
ncbi:hypothetical protein [Paenibacillus sp. DMB20]|uniref:hypothetical protein n=1 Tax=Paenibacillus sp. DMB20 TaxID=1642570 RepID=UPI0006277D48|nr:hypothetical protein [Paenibacillus sp. DMB20]KKO51115.1 hypothetical protein XI25_29455 [Paenibacillus sp. DMB20]